MPSSAGRPPAFDAIVLAGGASRRMGGGDKTRLEVGGVPLLDRALQAVTGAATIVVVGPSRPVPVTVRWTREDPVGAGPAAALAAGLGESDAPIVVTLAADLPFITPETVARLVSEAVPRGAVLVDAAGRDQWLLAAWPRETLRDALAGDQSGRSLRGAYASLDPVRLAAARPREGFDCDDPEDLRNAREMAP